MGKRTWTNEEELYLKENFLIKPLREIAHDLNKSIEAVRGKYKRLHLKLPADIIKERKVNNIKQIALDNKGYLGENNPNWKGGLSHNFYRYKKVQKERFPEKVKARQKVSNALKTGILIKGVCEVCQDVNVVAHHEDYSKPLEVNWLCRKHHRELHKQKETKNQ